MKDSLVSTTETGKKTLQGSLHVTKSWMEVMYLEALKFVFENFLFAPKLLSTTCIIKFLPLDFFT